MPKKKRTDGEGGRGHTVPNIDLAAKIGAASSALLYLNSLRSGFPYDDSRAVQENPDVLGHSDDGWTSSIADIFRNDFWGTPLSDPQTHKSYRPLVTLSFRLEASFALAAHGGAWVFHLGNVVLYALCAFLLVRHALPAALPELAAPAPAKNKTLLLSMAGLWFASHPVHVEAVAGLVGRAEILAAIFCLLASKLYDGAGGARSGGGTSSLLGSVVCFAAACLCKETAVVMPAVVAAIHLAAALLSPAHAARARCGSSPVAGAFVRGIVVAMVPIGHNDAGS